MTKGLGAGLSALFGDDTADIEPNDFEFVPISRVEPRKGQPRTNFDDEGLSELALSIQQHGMLQPLTVRRLNDGYYQIIAGERRWRASRMAGLTQVPVRIIDADDKKATELAMVENLQREGLNPVEEAKGYKTLMDEYDMTQEEIAARVSKSRPVIANALRLLSLPEKALKLLEQGQLAPGAARAVLGLESEQQMQLAVDQIIEKNLTVRQAEALVKAMKKPDKQVQEDTQQIKVDYFAEAEKLMEKSVGRKVRIVNGRKKGKIEIEYCGKDDLNALIDLIAAINTVKEEG